MSESEREAGGLSRFLVLSSLAQAGLLVDAEDKIRETGQIGSSNRLYSRHVILARSPAFSRIVGKPS